MFSMTQSSFPAGFVMPHGPYGFGNEQFLEFPADKVRFRLQRLGVYLVSDLFASSYMDSGGYVREKALTTMARGKIIYFTGELLDQWDLDVLMHCAAQTSLAPNKSRQLQLNPAELLRALGLRNDLRNRRRVYASLIRIHASAISIAGDDYCYMTGLVNRLLVDRVRDLCLLEVNADVVASLRRTPQTDMNVRDRYTLGRNGLAKWLHGVLLVFRGGFSANMDCLRRLAGAPDTVEHVFNSRIAKALEQLQHSGFIEEWELEQDVLRVVARLAETHHTACGYIASSVCS